MSSSKAETHTLSSTMNTLLLLSLLACGALALNYETATTYANYQDPLDSSYNYLGVSTINTTTPLYVDLDTDATIGAANTGLDVGSIMAALCLAAVALLLFFVYRTKNQHNAHRAAAYTGV